MLGGKNIMRMGRPKKNSDERTSYTIYLGEKVRKDIDEYVFFKKQDNPDYSRSDFLNEAAEFYLTALKKKQDKKDNTKDRYRHN